MLIFDQAKELVKNCLDGGERYDFHSKPLVYIQDLE